MHVLVTRPEPEAGRLAARLRALGLETSIDPLLAIEPCLPPHLDLAGVAALVVTSANAIKALAAHPDAALAVRLPVYVVGPATARSARAAGFADVTEGPAKARDLAALIVARCTPPGPGLLHLRGEEVAFDMASALAAAGIGMREVVAYRAVAAPALGAEIIRRLRDRRLDAVLLMSPRTAEIFVRLVAAGGLIEAATHPLYLCLSQAVAARLSAIANVRTIVPVKPNSEEMLALAARLAALSDARPT